MTMKRLSLLMLCAFGISSALANAPVSTLSISTSGNNASTSAPATDASGATEASPPQDAPVPQVVNSQAVLASLTPDERIARLENQVTYLNTYTTQVNSMSTQMDMLRGQIEDLNHQVADLQKQVTALAQAQATAAATQAQAAASDTKASSTADAPSAAEQSAYQGAYNLMAKKSYTPAIKAFNNFLTKYPKSTLNPNVHYWLGDLYLTQGQPDLASKQYRSVINTQDATKRPDAMVKLGTILLAYGDNSHAKTLFQNVVKQYPGTPEATQAKAHLKDIQ